MKNIFFFLVVIVALFLVACGANEQVAANQVAYIREVPEGKEVPELTEVRQTGELYEWNNPKWVVDNILRVEIGTTAILRDGTMLPPNDYPTIPASEAILVVPSNTFTWSTIDSDAMQHCNRMYLNVPLCETSVSGPSLDGIETVFDWDITLKLDFKNYTTKEIVDYLGNNPSGAIFSTFGTVARNKFLIRQYEFHKMYGGSVKEEIEESHLLALQAYVLEENIPLEVVNVTLRDVQPGDDRIRAAQEQLANEILANSAQQELVDNQMAQIAGVLEHPAVKNETWVVKLAVLQIVFGISNFDAMDIISSNPGLSGQIVPTPVPDGGN